MPPGFENMPPFLRDLLMAVAKPKMDRVAARLTADVEKSTDATAQHFANMDRTELMSQLSAVWLSSLTEGFAQGKTSFMRLADILSAQEYKILMLENMLRERGYDVPRESQEEKARTESAKEAPEGTYKCESCGNYHPKESGGDVPAGVSIMSPGDFMNFMRSFGPGN
jgi:hypothetical protein